MGHITKLPREVFQQIASFLSIHDKYRYIGTHTDAGAAFRAGHLELTEIWNKIIDPSWLKKMISKDYTPALIGYDLSLMDSHLEPSERPCFIALILIKPEQRIKERVADRKKRLEDPKERLAYQKENLANRKELLSALHSESFNEERSEVQFPNFILHIGNPLRRSNMFDAYRILHPEHNQTLVVYFNGKSTNIHTLPVEQANTWLTIHNKEGDGVLARFLDIEALDERLRQQ